jgi:hypothetical protein
MHCHLELRIQFSKPWRLPNQMELRQCLQSHHMSFIACWNCLSDRMKRLWVFGWTLRRWRQRRVFQCHMLCVCVCVCVCIFVFSSISFMCIFVDLLIQIDYVARIMSYLNFEPSALVFSRRVDALLRAGNNLAAVKLFQETTALSNGGQTSFSKSTGLFNPIGSRISVHLPRSSINRLQLRQIIRLIHSNC